MAEETYSWSAGAPITAEKMNRLQRDAEEVEVAHRESVSNDTLKQRFEAVEAIANTAATTASDVSARIQTINSNSALGAQAWRQMEELVTENSKEVKKKLTTRILGTESTLGNAVARLTNVEAQLSNAKRPEKQPEDSLALRFNDIDTTTTELSTRLNSTEGSVADINLLLSGTAQGKTPYQGAGDPPYAETLADRFYNDELKLKKVETQLDNAKTSTAYNLANLTLDDRFEMSEEEIVGARTSEARNTSYDSLDARFEANESEIMDAHSSTAKNSNFNSLDARFESIEDELVTARGGLGTVDARLDTIEENATALTNHVNTDFVQNSRIIPNLAATVAGNVLDATQGRILNERLTTAENGLATTTSGLATANGEIDALKTRMNAVDNSETGSIAALRNKITSDLDAEGTGLKAKVGALETAVTDQTSGLAATYTLATNARTQAQANAAAISHAASGDDHGGLTERINALESQPKSATQVISEVTYNENGIPTNIDDPSTNVDYLLKKDDKYYYWKYIQTGSNPDTFVWALISGGSGEGNTSGFDLTQAEYDGLQTHTVNTDYYVTATDGFVHHYRWIPGENETLRQIEIGTIVDRIKRYNMTTVNGTKTVEGSDTPENVTYLNLYEYNYNQDNTVIDTEAQPFAQIELPRGGGGGAASTVVNHLVRIGGQSVQAVVGSKIMLRVFYSSWDGPQSNDGQYVLKAGSTTIANGTFNSGASDEVINGWKDKTDGYYQFDVSDYCRVGTTNFNLTVTVNGARLGQAWSVNIIDLHIESTAPDTLLLGAEESYAFPYTPFGALQKTLHVIIDNDTENEIITSLQASTSGRASNFTIKPSMFKTPVHGVHSIEMYLTATIGNVLQSSNSVRREYIWYDSNNTDQPVILASRYNNQTIKATQYSTIEIPYQVYKKDASSIKVNYYLDNAETPYETITLEDTNVGTLTYLATLEGAHTLTIKVDNVSISTSLSITALDIDIAPVEGALIDFDPIGLTNSSAKRLPTWTTSKGTFTMSTSENFNWSDDANGGGYKQDKDGYCFVIKAGSYLNLDYKMFNSNVFDTGAEIKIIFKTDAVRTADAVWFDHTGSYNDKRVGIELGAHTGWLKTDKATGQSSTAADSIYDAWTENTVYPVGAIVRIGKTIYQCLTSEGTNVPATLQDDEDAWDDYLKLWLKLGQIDTQVLSTNSYLYLPYSEKDKIELDININKYESGSSNNFIMSYEDGVPSKAYAYTYGASGDGLMHSNGIHIGSPDCDVYIYHLRIYNNALTTAQILQNFIADGRDIDEKVARYNRNCIYWDSTQQKYFTSPSSTAVLDPIKLAQQMPDVKILMLDTPVFTVGKKDFIQNSTLRCIHARGGKIYESRGDADNWFFENGFHAGQGTTSDNYGQSSRNVDFLFEVDGTHYPTKAKNMKNYKPSKDYVSSVIMGETGTKWDENSETWIPTSVWDETEEKWVPNEDILSTEEIQDWTAHIPNQCQDWKDDSCKISLTKDSIPNNYFNLKVNVASSENVNNALFQERYNRFLNDIYPSPAYQRDHKIKNSMEFVPAILFVRENAADSQGNPVGHSEFNDCNWHFYALGNIGDSKKSDYTRAYDPDDMNEFTVENSDNNTNNGQFQSGVFDYQGHRAIETDYNAWSENIAYKNGDIVVYDGMLYQRSGADEVEGTTYSWVPSEWEAVEYTGWTDEAAPYFAPRTNPNPMEYVYPITSSQWNIKLGKDYLNRKHQTLVKEKFDGDHSFEFRYACKGDYRDGDLINDTNGNTDQLDEENKPITKDTIQYNLNHDVVLAFYEWLVTASPEQYLAEARQWFVPEAMEFFYAYTHYYTMMDNRAKNTFWHFAKTGRYYRVSRPVEALFHVYKVADGEVTANAEGIYSGTFVDPTGAFDASATYYTEYAFDLWAYDMDTAAGIDNNGALVFPYGKEDEDYREKEASSGYAFNGAGSIFWRRLKTTFADGIRTVMNNANADCFNSENLIQQFDSFQNCFPEEIWRLDIERKYIRTFTGKSVDGSITTGKQNPRFLTSMMQGRKKYQRRQWIRNQGIYFNSKYRLSDITRNENTIEFNIITPADSASLAVQPSYILKLTPYQDMYLNVQVGNGNYQDQIRAKAGEEYSIDLAKNTSGTFQETRVYINGFNSISGIGNLAPMYPYSFTLSALEHLKVLDLGTTNAGYRNANFQSLPFEETTQLPLLETLNIQNCNSLTGAIKLNTANNLRTIEANGSAITGVILPDYTQIETLHLPSTVSAVSLYGARFLDDFSMKNASGTEDYSGLYTLHAYDSDYSENVHWIDIARAMLVKEAPRSNVQLLKLSSATIGDIQTMNSFSQLKQDLAPTGGIIDFSGTIHVTGNWSDVEVNSYKAVWPQLQFDTSAGTQKTKHKVTYEYNDKSLTLYIDENAYAPDIYANGTIDEMPSKPMTEREIYQFGSRNAITNEYEPYSGWRFSNSAQTLNNTPITSDRTVVPYFTVSIRQYQVAWYLHEGDTQPFKVSNVSVPYGGGENLIAPTIQEIQDAGKQTAIISITDEGVVDYSYMTGWDKLPINIAPAITDTYYNIYATWESGSTTTAALFKEENLNNLTPLQLAVFAKMTSDSRSKYSVGVGTRVTYTTGFDYPGGIDLVAGNPLRLDASATAKRTFNDIQPLKAGNDAFTLAIDYCFNADLIETINTTYSTLVSCYYSDMTAQVRNGFSLYYRHKGSDQGPRVGFGDMYNNSAQSIAVGSYLQPGLRNIVVLRHAAGSPTLYVYSGLINDLTTPATVQSDSRSWSNYNSDAHLNFGQIGNDAGSNDGTPSIVADGKGTIFWAKYWPQDLGADECIRLATWPHEPVTMIITSVNDSPASDGSSIELTTLTASSHVNIVNDYSTIGRNATYSWVNFTKARDLGNQRIVQSLPIALQAVLRRAETKSSMVVYNSETGAAMGESASITNDYVRLQSVQNLGETNAAYDIERANTYEWNTDGNVTVYTLDNNNQWVITETTNRFKYLNLRFPMKAITWGGGMRVFYDPEGKLSNITTARIADTINSLGSTGIRSGDIYICNISNVIEAYMYVFSSDITTLGLQIATSSSSDLRFATATSADKTGGWIKGTSYWTRSVIIGGQQSRCNFASVTSQGMVDLVSTNATGRNICYSIKI